MVLNNRAWLILWGFLNLATIAYAEDGGESSPLPEPAIAEAPSEPTTAPEPAPAAQPEPATVFEPNSSADQIDVFVPSRCNDDGTYMPEQCKAHAEKEFPVAKAEEQKEEFDASKCDDEGTYMPEQCKAHAEKLNPSTVANAEDKKEEFDASQCRDDGSYEPEKCQAHAEKEFPVAKAEDKKEEVFDASKCDDEGTYMPEQCKANAEKLNPSTVAKAEEKKEEFDASKCNDEGTYMPEQCKANAEKLNPSTVAKAEEKKEEAFDPSKCEFDGYETEKCRAHAQKVSDATDAANAKRKKEEAARRALAAKKAAEEKAKKAAMDRWATDDTESRRMLARAPAPAAPARAPAATTQASTIPPKKEESSGVMGFIREKARAAREEAGYMVGFAKEVVTGGEAGQRIVADLRKTPKQLAEESNNAYTATVMGALDRTGNLAVNTGKAASYAASTAREHAGYLAGFAQEVATGGESGQKIVANLRKTPRQLAAESDNAFTGTVMGTLDRLSTPTVAAQDVRNGVVATGTVVGETAARVVHEEGSITNGAKHLAQAIVVDPAMGVYDASVVLTNEGTTGKEAVAAFGNLALNSAAVAGTVVGAGQVAGRASSVLNRGAASAGAAEGGAVRTAEVLRGDEVIARTTVRTVDDAAEVATSTPRISRAPASIEAPAGNGGTSTFLEGVSTKADEALANPDRRMVLRGDEARKYEEAIGVRPSTAGNGGTSTFLEGTSTRADDALANADRRMRLSGDEARRYQEAIGVEPTPPSAATKPRIDIDLAESGGASRAPASTTGNGGTSTFLEGVSTKAEDVLANPDRRMILNADEVQKMRRAAGIEPAPAGNGGTSTFLEGVSTKAEDVLANSDRRMVLNADEAQRMRRAVGIEPAPAGNGGTSTFLEGISTKADEALANPDRRMVLRGDEARKYEEALRAGDDLGAAGRSPAAAKDKLYSLDEAGAMTEGQRMDAAGRVVGRELSEAERKAVIDAHNIGEGRGYFEYTPTDLRQKMQTLTEAGLSREEASQVLRNGIAGQAADTAAPAVRDRLAKAVSDRETWDWKKQNLGNAKQQVEGGLRSLGDEVLAAPTQTAASNDAIITLSRANYAGVNVDAQASTIAEEIAKKYVAKEPMPVDPAKRAVWQAKVDSATDAVLEQQVKYLDGNIRTFNANPNSASQFDYYAAYKDAKLRAALHDEISRPDPLAAQKYQKQLADIEERARAAGYNLETMEKDVGRAGFVKKGYIDVSGGARH